MAVSPTASAESPGVPPRPSLVSDSGPGARTPTAVAGRRLGRYQLRYEVARGGMAAVFLAQLSSSAGFEKWVAIKTIHPHVASDARFVKMFLDEARLAARIDHPNVATVFDFGEDSGVYYLAMEYLHGEPLSEVARAAWRGGSFPIAAAAKIIAETARGLHAAHELRAVDGGLAGVVHRDVSPQNIFVLFNGVSKIVDFGIARSNEQRGDITGTGEIKGKLAYMSPEQMSQGFVDRRTDVWALGVVLWELLAGRRLFKRDTDARTMMAVINDPIPSIETLRADCPDGLREIVHTALQRAPNGRYSDAARMAHALERFLAQGGTPMGPAEVERFMRGLFAIQIDQRQLLLAVPIESSLESTERVALPSSRRAEAARAASSIVTTDLYTTFGVAALLGVSAVVAIAGLVALLR